MSYPVGLGEFMTVAKDSAPTLKQLRLLIKGIEHHLAMEAEAAKGDDEKAPANPATGAPQPAGGSN